MKYQDGICVDVLGAAFFQVEVISVKNVVTYL